MYRGNIEKRITTFETVGDVVAMRDHLARTDADHWSTRQDTLLLVTDMEYTHALHTVAMLVRWATAFRRVQAEAAGQAEELGLQVRGGVASDAQSVTWLRRKYPVFQALERRVAAEVAHAHGMRLAAAPKPRKKAKPIVKKKPLRAKRRRA